MGLILARAFLSAYFLFAALVMPLSAEGAKGDECAAKVRDFVRDLNYVMSLEQRSVHPLRSMVRKYFPTEGCRVDEVVAIARQSKFFWSTYETLASIAVHFRNQDFNAGFGVERDSGNIVRPYAQVRVVPVL